MEAWHLKSFARVCATLSIGLLVVLSPHVVLAGVGPSKVRSTPLKLKSNKHAIRSDGGLFSAKMIAAKIAVPAAAIGRLIPGSRAPVRAAFLTATAAPIIVDSVTQLWPLSLMERTLSESEKDADLSSDFREAMARIEGMYDPTRLDGTGQVPRMSVSAGTASMNNVFADRWSVADIDANVDYNVRYIAEAWGQQATQDCRSFTKRRFTFGGPILNSLSLSDCARIVALRPYRADLLSKLVVVAAPLNVPAFAAPEPGSRLSSHDFWIAQESRIAIMKENLRLRRQSAPFQRASQ